MKNTQEIFKSIENESEKEPEGPTEDNIKIWYYSTNTERDQILNLFIIDD